MPSPSSGTPPARWPHASASCAGSCPRAPSTSKSASSTGWPADPAVHPAPEQTPMSKTRDTEASISISRPTILWKRLTHMEFERVTFDLPHGTFHALQGGDPDGQPTLVLHGFPDHPPTAKPFLAELGRRGRHVVAPWLRGYAPSPTAGPFDFAALTSDVLALIDRWSP